MRSPPLRLLFVLSFALALAACGSDQDRPVVVDTFPEQGGELPSSIEAVRFTFDEPVSILNYAMIAIDSDGIGIPVRTRVDPDDPLSILVTPSSGAYWRNGENRVNLRAGFEVNEGGHYRLEDYVLRFWLGVGLPLFLAVPSPASVVEVDGQLATALGTVPTPDARVPEGLACSNVNARVRTWVQLEHGGGAGEALAFFEPGDAAMTALALTHEPGGDLVALHPAIEASSTSVYAAYRDAALGRVRLHEIDAVSGIETRTLVLSPPASPGTLPHGLSVALDGLSVDVACAGDAGALLVRVELESFTEVDLAPDLGGDGLPLPSGAGPARCDAVFTFVAPRAAGEAVLTKADPTDGTATGLPSVVLGSPTTLVRTPDLRWTVTGLAGFVDREAFSYRRVGALATEEPVVIDDDTGAGNGLATTVLDVTWLTGTSRLVALLDNDAAIVLGFSSSGVLQEDFDVSTPEFAIDLSAVAPGATRVAVPPPATSVD